MQKLGKKVLKKKVDDWNSSLNAQDRHIASPHLAVSSRLA